MINEFFELRLSAKSRDDAAWRASKDAANLAAREAAFIEVKAAQAAAVKLMRKDPHNHTARRAARERLHAAHQVYQRSAR